MSRSPGRARKGSEEIKIYVSSELLKGWKEFRKTRKKLSVLKIIRSYQKGTFPLIKDLNRIESAHNSRIHFCIPASSYKESEIIDILWSFLLHYKYVKDFFDVD